MNLLALITHCSRACRDIAPALFDHLWQSSLFACVVCVLAVGLRRHPARTRYWVWLAGSAKFLLPFALLIGLGSHMGRSTQTKAGLYATLDVAGQPFTESAIRSAHQHVAATAIDSQSSLSLLPLLVVAVWGCGVAMMLLFWWMQHRQIGQMTRDANLLQGGRESEALQRLRGTSRHADSLDVLVSHRAMEPGVIGIIHPVLLWPTQLSSRLEDSQLDTIFMHELCHIQRRDNLTSAIQMLVASLFWFHPLVWWFGARLIEERERACDEEVLRHSEPTVYAKSILAVCEFCADPSPMCVSGITGADLKSRINRIMTNRVQDRLGRLVKAILLVLLFAAFAGPISFGLMHGRIPLYGQILHPSVPLPSYEVATIKPMQPGYTPPRNVPSGVMIHIGSIKQLIGLAYNLPPLSVTQIIGEPDWAAKDKYVVQAKIEDAMIESLRKMSPAQSQVQHQLLLQSLLADRLKLRVRFETRELPMYAMVVAKGGSKLRPAQEIPEATDTVLPPPMAPGATPSLSGVRKGFFAYLNGSTFQMQAKALSLDELAQMLQRQPDVGGRLIVNQTGINGYFDCTMKWTTEMMTTALGERPPDADEPSFFNAIREQLGLRLVPTKGPAEVIVIDHIERPSEN